jgi:hypothetical protein
MTEKADDNKELLAEMSKLSVLAALFEAAAENETITLSLAEIDGIKEILESAMRAMDQCIMQGELARLKEREAS